MARRTKRRRKRGRFKLILLLLFTPLAIWLFAFIVWLYWQDIGDLVSRISRTPTAQKTQQPSREKILDEDRKKLEEILKQRK